MQIKALPSATKSMGYSHGAWFALIRQAERFYRAPFMVMNLLGLVKMLTFKKYKIKNFPVIIMLNQLRGVPFTSHFNRSPILVNRLTSHEQRKCLYLPGPAYSSSIFLPLFSLFPIITLSIAQSEHCHMSWAFFSLEKTSQNFNITVPCFSS